MKELKNDRRSQRTRHAISDALVELMMEKHYDSITVQEIIDRANVGRSTFYSHYIDKDDLLTSQLERVGREMEASFSQDYPLLPIKAVFTHVGENHRHFMAFMRGSSSDFIVRAMHNHLDSHLKLLLQEKSGNTLDPLVVEMVAYHITAVLMNLLLWWLEHRMPFTTEEMDRRFHEMVVPGIEQTLGIRLGT